MSDHSKEAERNLKRIFICDDIYLDVFRLLAPAKVGLELALVSDRFDALVDTHFKSRKWTLGRFDIWSEEIVIFNEDGSRKKTLPFPQEQWHNSIVGFSSVDFYSISINSADAIAFFLQCIGRLLESNVSLHLYIDEELKWNTFATSIWPQLNASGIVKIHFAFSSVFHHFRRLISPSILCDCSNLRFITFNNAFLLEFPPDDSDGLSDGQAVSKWLHSPRADGRPKVLRWNFSAGDARWKSWERDFFPMDALKKTFLSAVTSVNFIIHLFSYVSFDPFELVNSLTRERLTSRPIGSYLWLIERSPIDKNTEQWAEWEREALGDGKKDWKVLRMFLCLIE